ncbi:MAG: translocation/assembly module TamB domain-containing protein, partial [Vicinamibacterales bacterium]
GNVTLGRARDTLAGHLEIAVTDVRTLGGETVARWHPAGRLHAQVDLAGTAGAPAATVRVEGSGLSVAGQDLGTLSATATASASEVTVADAVLRQADGGRLVASGRYVLNGDPGALRVQADRLLLSPVWIGSANTLPLAAQVDGTLDIGGTLDRPTGGGRLDLADLQWADAYVERVAAGLALADGTATLDLDAPVLAVHARAVASVAEPYTTTVTVDATETDVAAAVARAGSFAPALLHEVAGRVRAHITATGRPSAIADAVAEARIDTLSLSLRGATLQLDAPAAARYDAGNVTVPSFRVRTGDTRLQLSGSAGTDASEGITATLDGALQDLRPWFAAFGAPAALDMTGTLAVTARAAGPLDRPELTADATVADGRVTWPDTPAVTDVATTITLRNGVVDVPAVNALWQGGRLNAQARVPLRFLQSYLPAALVPDGGVAQGGAQDSATARVRLDRLTPELAAPWVDAATLADLTGRATVELDLSAERPEIDAVTGTLRIPQLEMQAHGVPIEQRRPTRIELASGRVRVADWEWSLAGSPLVVTGTAGLAADGPLDLRVDGRVDMAMLGLVIPNGVADGTGALALSLRGTTSAPVADGTVTLSDVELQVSDPRIGLSGLTGSILFQPGRIELQRVTGTLNGGQITLAGGLEYTGTTLTGGRVTLEASHAALDVPEGVRSEVNAALALTAAGGLQLTGRLDILRGGYREPLSLAAALALAGRDAALALTPAAAGPSRLDEIGVNVVVASAEDLVVDNNYGRLALGLDLRLVGTLAQPSVVGRSEIRSGGALFLGGRTYLVDRGVIDFSDPRRIVPYLDITGRTRVNGTDASGAATTYDITLEITGTPDTLKTALTSTPDRSQADIVSLLATGRLADQVGGAGTAIARDQFIGYLSGDTLGFAARAIGVDAIRFERGANAEDLSSDASLAGEVNPAQRLTVSRRFLNKAELTVSQNLRDTGRQTWIASLTPGRSVELRALSRDDTSRSYEVRHDVAFGGPPAASAPPVRAAGVPVVAVRVTGDTVLPAHEVERHLRLTPGRRFDFLRWQEDRDRLRTLYVDRGYREARISVRQVPTPAADGTPGVTLEYQIAAHAPTVLEVEGVALPDAVRQEVERIWDNAILDVGLIGDVEAAVRAHLAAEGFLRARVRVRRLAADDATGPTRLHVRVSPGARSAARTLDVTGNTVLPTAEIDAIAVRHGAGAWLRPGALADDIRDRYLERGHLAATVQAGPTVFEGDRAVLPIRIVEGAPFTVGPITIAGATARREAAARRDLGIAEGEAFTPDLLPRGRQALVTAYTKDGFNDAAVAIGTTVDATRATVHLQVTIEEGAQQVVSDVSVTGAEGVAPGVVNGAMQVTPGMPADMEQLYAGRRRLFQTGLFRRADVEVAPMPGIEAPAGVEPVRAVVTLVRTHPWRVRYGVSVTDELAPIVEQGRTFGGGANVALERHGLFGRPGSSVMSFRYNDDQQVARGSVAWPTLFGRAISSRFYASRARDSVSGENILSFVTDRTTFTAEQRLSVGTRTQIAYAYQLERNHVFAPDADPDDPFSLDERWRQSRLSASFVFDNRSDLTEPGRGLLHSSTVEFGLESLGRNGRFLKYSLQELHFA